MTSLFDKNNIAGIFRGFTQGGLEFHADLVLPYRIEFQTIPMHGQLIMVQLENPNEAVLGRIASFSSEGRLSFGAGEEFSIRAAAEDREVPDDLREQYLRYRINIRVLGSIRLDNGDLVFVPSQRRLPHVGSRVAFPSSEILRKLTGHDDIGAEIGHFALGEYVYAGGAKDAPTDRWIQVKTPEIQVHFPIESMVSRRTFCFARAGFGKSNLTKLLFSKLYETQPAIEKRQGRLVPVGTVIFDPDGEYFWPDDKGRPALADVLHLVDKLVVFTNRKGPSRYYQSFVAAGVRLDLRRLNPSDVVSLALSPEKQDQQNVRKLKSMSPSNWMQLVDLIFKERNNADIDAVAKLMMLDKDNQRVEAFAARSNMTTIVANLHDPNSRMIERLLKALKAGKLCVFDLSQMRGSQGMMLASIILRRIFDHNQMEFTNQKPETIPTVAVIEEAQSVLVDNGSASAEPFISWVKEGRKYDLGAMLITQQPGSIPHEILSQGDNWFVFHLISAGDLLTLKKANAHFSDDLLSSLLNEPIPGHAVFWSSVKDKPFPVSVRIQSFEKLYELADPDYNRPSGETWAITEQLSPEESQSSMDTSTRWDNIAPSDQPVDESDDNLDDYLTRANKVAIEGLRQNTELMRKIQSPDGAAWKEISWFLTNELPEDFGDIKERQTHAFKQLTKIALTELFGDESTSWFTFRNEHAPPNKNGSAPVHVSTRRPTSEQ